MVNDGMFSRADKLAEHYAFRAALWRALSGACGINIVMA